VGEPLAGVIVTIAGTSLQATTDGNGVFTFGQPVTGDQTLIVDGTNVPAPTTGPARKFSISRVVISVGISQSNVLQTPII